MQSRFPLVVFIVGALAAAPASAREPRPAEAVPGEILVGFRENFAPATARTRLRASLAAVLGVDAVEAVLPLAMDAGIAKVVLRDSTRIEAALSQLRTAFVGPGTAKYVEPNFVYRADSTEPGEPNDPGFDSLQWSLRNIGQVDRPTDGQAGLPGSDIHVVPLWREGVIGDSDFVVAVIDSGVDYAHPDLAANVHPNPREIPGNGLDDDGDGIVDDVYGADFSRGRAVGNGLDDNDHGTHCAGTIGATGNDGRGIAGVNWRTSILPVKFLDGAGRGSTEDAVNAIKYAVRRGAKVLSNSWGGGAYSDALRDAIREAGAAGALFVAAAGNDAADTDVVPHYPASYDLPNVVSVAATDNRDALAYFSSFGRTTVHVAAPGRNIVSTVRGGGYAAASGTSMAAPLVAGIAALVWSAHPEWGPEEVKRRLIATSDPLPALRTRSISGGRVNAFQAFHGIEPARDEPAESEWRDVPFTAESAHPYANDADSTVEIAVPGAKLMRVVYERLETEAVFDGVTLESVGGEIVDATSGAKSGRYVTDYIRADRAIVRLKSDGELNGYGFKIAKLQVVDP